MVHKAVHRVDLKVDLRADSRVKAALKAALRAVLSVALKDWADKARAPADRRATRAVLKAVACRAAIRAVAEAWVPAIRTGTAEATRLRAVAKAECDELLHPVKKQAYLILPVVHSFFYYTVVLLFNKPCTPLYRAY